MRIPNFLGIVRANQFVVWLEIARKTSSPSSNTDILDLSNMTVNRPFTILCLFPVQMIIFGFKMHSIAEFVMRAAHI